MLLLRWQFFFEHRSEALSLKNDLSKVESNLRNLYQDNGLADEIMITSDHSIEAERKISSLKEQGINKAKERLAQGNKNQQQQQS